MLFLVPADTEDIAGEYNVLLSELKKYNPELLDKDRLLAISKADMLDDELKALISEQMKKDLPKGLEWLFISSVSQHNLGTLKDKLWSILNKS